MWQGEEPRKQLLDREAGLTGYELYFRSMELGFGLREAIEKKLRTCHKIRLFDIGCGKATALRELKEIFGEKIFTIGLDAIKEKEHGIDEFIAANALQTEFPKNCDVVVSFRAMHEMGNCKKTMEKIEKSLKKGGEAFLSIRCQEFKENRIQNLGKITKTDIDFLLETLRKKRFNSLKAEGNHVPMLLQGIVVDKKTGEKSIGAVEYIAGVNVFLKKH